MSNRRIKRGRGKQGALVTSQEPVNYDERPPGFSLEKVESGKQCLSGLDQTHKDMFSDASFRRKGLTWRDIKTCDRHGVGTEKISKSSIDAPIPRFITEDVSDFLVFRYNGLNPMVGYRQRDVFFVLWFDHDFTLYNH